jgi:uncharacterized Rmd1/YagE family protein
MLDVVSDEAENEHASYLEWVVIILVGACAAIGLIEVLATLGIVGPGIEGGH